MLDARVLMTLGYSDQFQYPLTLSEVRLRLISFTDDGERRVGERRSGSKSRQLATQLAVKRSLQRLVRRGLAIHQRDTYFLNRSENQLWPIIRRRRTKISQHKLAEIQSLIKIIKFIPWIQGVAVTGSVAVNNAHQQSDIDLMIVSSRNRLWLSRAVVAVLTTLLGKRRTWQGEEADSWCFNLWLDWDHLAITPAKQELYTAYEVCQAQWLLTRQQVELEFLMANQWVSNYLPQYFKSRLQEAKNKLSSNSKNSTSLTAKSVSNSVAGTRHAPLLQWLATRVGDTVNWLFYLAQLVYMTPHMTRERVSRQYAFFHPRDTKSQVMSNWRQSLQFLQESGS